MKGRYSRGMTDHQQILFALGGNRSGKSDYAENSALALAKSHDLTPIYIATGQAFDDEMKARIKRHLDRRDPSFTTIEEPINLADIINQHDHHHVLLIDSLGVWITNLMVHDRPVDEHIASFLAALKDAKSSVVLVSDEIGMGIVPENAMARAFRDHLGLLNQGVAELANSVVFMVAGLPMMMKSNQNL